ncbi:facilitated trehalose transporter Tret1-like [Eupeodes corollae]|uniref:facilitated trehalose transporter Tret1-like n=1 Tax=Eupeodes corollae TaxID=290404 RepID=UPI0024907250|nr:facilitated trehalose transporter Tret1-like [Eupeodes corollae]XP_055909004.1 facilitated trehalose transporter Tret1-like [Eupeodes corollae]XP_055909005.1 facilitated trehalose transporter Tret1-like [Eupeodes corollae]
MLSAENPANCTKEEETAFYIDPGRKPKMEPVKKSRVYLAAVCANLSSFAIGTCLGWTSPIIPKLQQNTDDSPMDVGITKEEEAWISSLIAIGALVAPFVAGPLADWIGRKWTMLSSTIFFIAAYVLMIYATEVEYIYASRLIMGFGVGFVMTVQPMYVGEISTDDTRGALGSFMQLFIVSGILYVYAIGPFVSYLALQLCCLVIPIVFAVVFVFLPESPYYYAGKGKKEESLKALQFLRGQSAEGVKDEMALIQATIDEAAANKGTVADVIKNKGNRKALFICAGLIAFQQCSGINVVLFNSQAIFINANTGIDPAIATIIIGCVQVGSSALTPIIADRMGRKVILSVSAAGMSIALAALGAFFYAQARDEAEDLLWLPVPALIIFNIVYCIGFGPLPWAVLGEMFPSNVKSIASSIVASTCWTFGFVITRYYPALDALGAYYAFWLFGIFCALGFFFVLIVVMETKGLSLQQIQDKLNCKKQDKP